ncbi:MAG TPA: methyltransferase domain-containing protein [Jatrophihabitans sp.]|nr:methyltransferase domain-containing protein [Jatrophihabitans sp.]
MSASELVAIEDIGSYYDQMGGLIEIMGGNIHVGYWTSDDDQTPLLEAINRLTDIVGEALDLQPGEHAIDIGCGVGVPAIRLAQRVEARITGVTISAWQVQEATRRIKAAGLRGQVVIEYGDAAALAYPDASFDKALVFQSLQHASDLGQWLRETVRVVRPGGRIVLTEFITEVGLTPHETEILLAGAMHPPLRHAELLDIVRANGLVIDDVIDCGDRIRKSYPSYFDRLDRHREHLVEAFGEERIQQQRDAMATLLPIYRDKIGYLIITGHRPE